MSTALGPRIGYSQAALGPRITQRGSSAISSAFMGGLGSGAAPEPPSELAVLLQKLFGGSVSEAEMARMPPPPEFIESRTGNPELEPVSLDEALLQMIMRRKQREASEGIRSMVADLQ